MDFESISEYVRNKQEAHVLNAHMKEIGQMFPKEMSKQEAHGP